jgi:hypothetical protein
MAGYAVSARIERAAVRAAPRIAHDVPGRRREPDPVTDETVDLVGRPVEVVIAERWSLIRESWAQTTFFLFDPESWR